MCVSCAKTAVCADAINDVLKRAKAAREGGDTLQLGDSQKEVFLAICNQKGAYCGSIWNIQQGDGSFKSQVAIEVDSQQLEIDIFTDNKLTLS